MIAGHMSQHQGGNDLILETFWSLLSLALDRSQASPQQRVVEGSSQGFEKLLC